VLYPAELPGRAAAILANSVASPHNGAMHGIIIRTLITMLGLFVASALIPGVHIDGTGTFILAAILLGLVNAFVRPILFVLTLPITILTLGLFLLVLNAAMFGLVAALLEKFAVAGLGSAILGALIVGIVSTLASWYIGPTGRYEVYVVTRHD
jgi:putative membrane protein